MGTRLTLAATVRRLIDEEDSTNSHFDDDPEIYDYLNQGIRYLGTDLEWAIQTAEATSVEDQAVYSLPDNFISLSDVYFDDNDLIILDRSDLSALSTTWQNSASGTPRFAYKSDNAKFGLYPKPNAVNAGLTIQIQYIKIPADLSDDATSPDLHSAFQDCLPFYAAFLCEKKLGNLKAADHNLNLYEMHKKRLVSRLQRFSDDLYRFRWADPRSYY